MNGNIEYEKFAQEIYNETLKNLYVKNIEIRHNVKLTGKSGQKHQIDVGIGLETHSHKIVFSL